jgi:hypothetical protein
MVTGGMGEMRIGLGIVNSGYFDFFTEEKGTGKIGDGDE